VANIIACDRYNSTAALKLKLTECFDWNISVRAMRWSFALARAYMDLIVVRTMQKNTSGNCELTLPLYFDK